MNSSRVSRLSNYFFSSSLEITISGFWRSRASICSSMYFLFSLLISYNFFGPAMESLGTVARGGLLLFDLAGAGGWVNTARVASVGLKDNILVTFWCYGDDAAFYPVSFSVIGNERMNKQIKHAEHKCCEYRIWGCCLQLMKEFL